MCTPAALVGCPTDPAFESARSEYPQAERQLASRRSRSSASTGNLHVARTQSGGCFAVRQTEPPALESITRGANVSVCGGEVLNAACRGLAAQPRSARAGGRSSIPTCGRRDEPDRSFGCRFPRRWGGGTLLYTTPSLRPVGPPGAVGEGHPVHCFVALDSFEHPGW